MGASSREACWSRSSSSRAICLPRLHPALILWAGVGETAEAAVIFIGSVFQNILMVRP